LLLNKFDVDVAHFTTPVSNGSRSKNTKPGGKTSNIDIKFVVRQDWSILLLVLPRLYGDFTASPVLNG